MIFYFLYLTTSELRSSARAPSPGCKSCILKLQSLEVLLHLGRVWRFNNWVMLRMWRWYHNGVNWESSYLMEALQVVLDSFIGEYLAYCGTSSCLSSLLEIEVFSVKILTKFFPIFPPLSPAWLTRQTFVVQFRPSDQTMKV